MIRKINSPRWDRWPAANEAALGEKGELGVRRDWMSCESERLCACLCRNRNKSTRTAFSIEVYASGNIGNSYRISSHSPRIEVKFTACHGFIFVRRSVIKL